MLYCGVYTEKSKAEQQELEQTVCIVATVKTGNASTEIIALRSIYNGEFRVPTRQPTAGAQSFKNKLLSLGPTLRWYTHHHSCPRWIHW